MSYKNTDKLTDRLIDCLLVDLGKEFTQKQYEGIIVVAKFDYNYSMPLGWDNLYRRVNSDGFSVKAQPVMVVLDNQLIVQYPVYIPGCGSEEYVYIGTQGLISRKNHLGYEVWVCDPELIQEKRIKEFDLNYWYRSIIKEALAEKIVEYLSAKLA